ncbi:MAG: alpha/beta hydrolase [Caldilineaceae bacterium]
MADFAADAVSVLDAPNINKAHVFGGSMGGAIAQHVALDYPDRILGLILGCTIPTGALGHPKVVAPSPEVFAKLTRPKTGNRAQDIESSFPLVFTPRFIEGNSTLLERWRNNLLADPECSPADEQLQLEAVVNTHDTYDLLGAIRHPTLIQTGTEDLLVLAENSRIMASLIPHARVIEYENYGHDFLTEGGEKVINDILAFLDEVDRTT